MCVGKHDLGIEHYQQSRCLPLDSSLSSKAKLINSETWKVCFELHMLWSIYIHSCLFHSTVRLRQFAHVYCRSVSLRTKLQLTWSSAAIHPGGSLGLLKLVLGECGWTWQLVCLGALSCCVCTLQWNLGAQALYAWLWRGHIKSLPRVTFYTQCMRGPIAPHTCQCLVLSVCNCSPAGD